VAVGGSGAVAVGNGDGLVVAVAIGVLEGVAVLVGVGDFFGQVLVGLATASGVSSL